MGETLNVLFYHRDDGTFELELKEGWSERTVIGRFVPPYTPRQMNTLQKKLNDLDSSYNELRDIGHRLFRALCGSETPASDRAEPSEQSVQAVLRVIIQRTLKRRGTVALTFIFGPGCDEFVRYPWELLHNGNHFLLVSGIFTLTRALWLPDMPSGNDLPVNPPLRVLYIGASPVDCVSLETERSYEELRNALTPLLDIGHVFLDRLEPPTFDNLVSYLNSYGGASALDDNNTSIPCYVVHFDGHGTYGRLCPRDECGVMNEAEVRKCSACGTSLSRIKPQTYLCFCNEEGCNHYIDTQSLRDLFLSSDVHLAVFSVCEMATLTGEPRRSERPVVDATLATALVTAQVPAVVAMPFSLQDDLSPVFVRHFYEALVDGRTLEEALARARQALLPMQQKSWFIPVLYRQVMENDDGPVPLLARRNAPAEHEHPLAYLGAPEAFIGRAQELNDLDELLTAATSEPHPDMNRTVRLRPGTHHFALTGPAGIGKSALAFEAAQRNKAKFPGGIIGVSLLGGKPFTDALLEMMDHLHIPTRSTTADASHRARLVLGTLFSLANRKLPCLILLDGFEEVHSSNELEEWLHFLSNLPQEVVVLLTSRLNLDALPSARGSYYHWYDYRVGKMTDADLLALFAELATTSGLDQRIRFYDSRQQAVLREICTLLDGYPLGAELIFGATRSIGGRVYTPEAATRSLEEVRDELCSTPLAGILAVLEIAYARVSSQARLLLSYLSVFKLPFNREQILVLIAPTTLAMANTPVQLVHESQNGRVQDVDEVVSLELTEQWSEARDELVRASFVQFDGGVYTIHPQIRKFAFSHLPFEERQRIHRIVAVYYTSLPQPSHEEWFMAFDHLESAGATQDLQAAVHLAVRVSWALARRGHATELLVMLRRAEVYATRVTDKTGKGQIQCCIGAILREQGQYTEAEGYLRNSLGYHKQLNESTEAGWALYELALLYCEEGIFQIVSRYAQEGLALFREENNINGENWMLMVMGKVSCGLASYNDALRYFDKVLNTFRTLNDKEGCASTLSGRGNVYEALGQHVDALQDYEEAFHFFYEEGNWVAQAWILLDQSIAYTNLRQLEHAEKICNEAFQLFHDQGIRRGEAWALYVRGNILHAHCKLLKARTCYDEALSIFTDADDLVAQARVLNTLGTISFEEAEYQVSRDLYKRALIIAREREARLLLGQALRGLGNVEVMLLDFVGAENAYKEAIAIAIEMNILTEQYAVLVQQGLLYRTLSRYSEVLECWVRALTLEKSTEYLKKVKLQYQVDQIQLQQKCSEIDFSQQKINTVDLEKYQESQMQVNLQREISVLVVEHHLENVYDIMVASNIGGMDSVPILVKHLNYDDDYIRNYIYNSLKSMPGSDVIPPLLDALNESTISIHIISSLLLEHPQEAIPLLINVLSDDERGDNAEFALTQFHPSILSSIVPGIDILTHTARARRALAHMKNIIDIGRPLHVLLYYPFDSTSSLYNLYEQLEIDNIDLQLIDNDLMLRENWKKIILKSTHNIDVFIVCISHYTPGKVLNDIYKKIEFALSINEERPESDIFILPLRMDPCHIPTALKRWQWNNLFENQGYERLLSTLGLKAQQIVVNYYWEIFQSVLWQTLFEQGFVDFSLVPDLPIIYLDMLLKRYMQEHPEEYLEFRESKHSLHLLKHDYVQKILNAVKNIQKLIEDKIQKYNLLDFEKLVEQLLQKFFITFEMNFERKWDSKGLLAFLIEIGGAFENVCIPKHLPFLVFPDNEVSDLFIEHLRRFLLLKGIVGSETQVAVLLLFCDDQKLKQAKQRLTARLVNAHACDIVVINHKNLLEIVSTKEPETAWCNCVLSQMDLVAVAPYTIAGPTPPHFFFGREHEMREISDHLGTASYIIIGGRLIGKTSIVNRLHCTRLPDSGFRTLSFDCSTVSTYNAFLASPVRNWKPEPPPNAPSTFNELFQCPPEDKPLVLLLDEVDKFVPVDRDNDWKLFNMLRSLINARRIQVVLSGERTLREALKDPKSPLFNFANLMLLGPLDYSAIEVLVTRPMKQLGIEIMNQASVVNHIYEFTSGHPNVVQRLCRRLVERLNKRGIRQITLDDVKVITSDPHFQEHDFLQTYWESATPLEKMITLVLSQNVKGYHLREVRHLLAEEAQIRPNATETKDALDRLVELRSILKHTQNGYEFAVTAFPRVLNSTTTIDDLLEVLVEQYNKAEHRV